jgi:aminopeptidase YwaD
VKNVVGVVQGKGELAKEYVVIGAHYDHLGRGGPGSLAPRSHEIHNGADDNASGTTAMMAIAEHYARSGSNARSLLFVAFTAEEEGLIGSQKVVERSPVAVDHIAYMLNLDMVGRVRNETIFVGGGGTAPSFEKIVEDADKASPLVVKSYGKGGMGPSDHMTFATKRIPVLFFHSGTHVDYHRPTDDSDKINYPGIKEVVDLAAGVIDKLLTLPREQYVEAADAHSMFGGGPGQGPGGGTSFKASLGVIPDYAAEDVKGVRINGTSPGSPADKAGLKDGDVLTQWDGHKMDSVYDLTDELTKAKPGQKVKISVLRGADTIEVEATLAEPRR